MNKLAIGLNKLLDGTVAANLLSELGKNYYFPKGIVAQSAEAKKYAKRYNATVGMAYREGSPMHLVSIKQFVPDLKNDEIFSYAPTAGVLEFRKLWKEEIISKNPSLNGKETSLPVVVSGLTHGIVTIADLFTDPGDTVVIPDMFWGNYRLIFEVRKKAEIVTFPFFNSSGRLNTAALEETLNSTVKGKKIMLVLNFPNNPTGYSPTAEEAENIAEILKKTAEKGKELIVVSDDAYFGLFYEEETYKESIFAKLADLHDNILAVKVDGATKENLVWGFRIGFITFAGKSLTEEQYDALVQKTMGAVRSSVSSSSKIAQSLLIRAMKNSSYNEEKQSVFSILKERYLTVKEMVKDFESNTLVSPLPFNSGYFMTFSVKKRKAEDLRRYLLMNRGIGTISVGTDYLRVAYSSIDKKNLKDLYREILKASEKI
ncbi:MAG: aminotransferase class I/II-fold pyridoxal phosphate-dependent enzyme [Spirochaetales bacterium]|nr:aminotransferase class I/II-fold pyridoxal phosphate-dependent enzyme [Spirochaetales bacterium]